MRHNIVTFLYYTKGTVKAEVQVEEKEEVGIDWETSAYIC